MLALYEQYKSERIERNGLIVPPVTMIKDRDGICLFLWHALLFTVIEFLENNQSIPKSLSSEISVLYFPLKEFRNCTFHVQDNFFYERYDQLMTMEHATERVQNVHSAIGTFLEAELRSLPPREKGI
jgi:hypothetical protein